MPWAASGPQRSTFPSRPYSGQPAGSGAANLTCSFFGKTTPFSSAQLAALYPSLDDYVSKVATATAAAQQAGFILAADAPLIAQQAQSAQGAAMNKPRMLTLRATVGFLLLGVYAGACGSAGSHNSATSNGSPTGRVSSGSDAASSAGIDAATVAVGPADEGGLSTDDGGLSSDDGGLASDDGGVSSADGGLASDDGAIAVCVSPGASSTASASGYLGDWTPGDYPSDFTDAGDYLRATRGTSSSSCRTVT